MNRRAILKSLPLLALAGVAENLEGVEAKAYALESRKKYVFVLHGDVEREGMEKATALLRGRGIDATIIANAEDVKIYELQ